MYGVVIVFVHGAITLECAGVLRCPSGPVHQLSDQTDRLWARLKEVCHGIIG